MQRPPEGLVLCLTLQCGGLDFTTGLTVPGFKFDAHYWGVGGHCSRLHHKDDLGPAASYPQSALPQMDIFHVFVVLTFCFGVADQKKFSSCVYIVWLHQDKVWGSNCCNRETKAIRLAKPPVGGRPWLVVLSLLWPCVRLASMLLKVLVPISQVGFLPLLYVQAKQFDSFAD